jgi:hypothetical protein
VKTFSIIFISTTILINLHFVHKIAHVVKYKHIFFYTIFVRPLGLKIKSDVDMDMPFGHLRISIPGLAHYGGGLEQGLED